jgi:glyoxylase-like metal-dependent hydrolase (beta-lactamase superfamily II)
VATAKRDPSGTVEWIDAQVARFVLPLPLPDLDTVNAYALISDDGLTLIDPGWATPENEAVLLACLAKIGQSPESVRQILVTHAHWDHYTQAVAWQRRYGASLHLGRGEQPSIEAITALKGIYPRQADLLRRNGAPALAAQIDALEWEPYERDRQVGPPDIWLDDGERIPFGDRTIVAHATPGHTRGHIVFEDPAAGLLFTGDHILPRITPSIAFEREPGTLPLRDYLRSLQLFVDRPDARMLPAHGSPQPGTRARAVELLEHHRMRLATIAELVGQGYENAFQIAQQMRWTRRNLALAELGVIHGMTAVLEVAAHLALLARHGEVAEHVGDVTRYSSQSTHSVAP